MKTKVSDSTAFASFEDLTDPELLSIREDDQSIYETSPACRNNEI